MSEQEFVQRIEAAVADKTPLNIVAGNSKAFYGRAPVGEPLHVASYHGITSYEPTELVITARAGTTLEEIEHALGQNNQMLPFEPPHYGPGATIGGTVACNFSGPLRAYQGAARDFVLGTKIINGRGEVLRFGGEVMKNVAGYDVSRLMCGAMGTLGLMLEISLKVLPKPASELTLVFEADAGKAIEMMNQWAGRPLPVSATAWVDDQLYLRMSGTQNGVKAASKSLGGQLLEGADAFWRQVREQQHSFFNTEKPLWRLSLPSTTSPLFADTPCLMEWGGGLRWLISESPAEEIFSLAKAKGGHATLFSGGNRQGTIFQPLDPGLLALHRNLKQSFDPYGIFNPGRMSEEF
ncbi:MAG: glycolate oxidase subunit GlcE [Gammaproteobacteria bacterium]|nr:glycolate oxidase subunit GlcE [Gammaproteobacteria bacterium]